jgi:hypothetical protein
MMALGALITFGSMFMFPLIIGVFGFTWWSVLLGVACFAVALAIGARLWAWAIDAGYRWLPS